MHKYCGNVKSYIFSMGEIAVLQCVMEQNIGPKAKDLTVLLSCNGHGSKRA
jgi:hypothetical protein